MLLRYLSAIALSLAVILPAQAKNIRYVSDQIFIVLHSGPGADYRWTARLTPGTRLEVARTAKKGKWTEVTTPGGTTGWVNSDFLSPEAPAQVRLPATEARARELSEENAQLSAQLRELQAEKSQLLNSLSSTGSELGDISQELAALKQVSGNAIQLDIDNRRLVEETETLRAEVDMLEAENQRLEGKLQSEDFINGALAVLLGVIITLVLPRLWPKRRKSSSWA